MTLTFWGSKERLGYGWESLAKTRKQWNDNRLTECHRGGDPERSLRPMCNGQ